MAKQAGIQLSVDIQYLLNKVNEAIDTLNNRGKYKKVKLSADENALATSIRKAIQNINADGRLKNKPVNIAANEAQLLKSIKTAINNINTNGSLNGKSVKLKANLNIDEPIKRVKSQIAGIVSQSNSINIGQNANNPALDKAVSNVRKELQAEGEQLKANNNYLRERITLYTKSGNVSTSRKYGADGENTIVNATNGTITSAVQTTDNSRIAAEQAKAEAAINRTRNALAALRAEYADANASKPIENGTENFQKLEAEYNNIIKLINQFEQVDNKNTAQFKVNVESKIADFEQMIAKFQRTEYAPTSLRTKDVSTSAAIEANRLKEFVAQVKSSDVPFEKMKSTISGLELSLSKIKDSASLTDFLNKFAIAKSEFSALKSESKALTSELSKVDSATKQIANSIKTLESKGNQNIFLKNGGNAEVIAMQERFADLSEKICQTTNRVKVRPLCRKLNKSQ